MVDTDTVDQVVTAKPRGKGSFADRDYARQVGAVGNAKRAAGETSDQGISDRMVRKAQTAIGSLNPQTMKDTDRIALARAAIDVAGLKRQATAARDLDAEILAVYAAIREYPPSTQD